MPEQRRHLIASVMAELRGYIDAVDDFETAVAQHFGLARRDLRWLMVLRDRDGIAATELADISGLSVGLLHESLEQLVRAGHMVVVDGVVHGSGPTRELLTEVLAPVEAAETGLHRYGADELGIVRNFLRVGRRFYERRFERFDQSYGGRR